MKSSHQVHLEMIEQTLQPTSCFQLHSARHKVLVVRDALADDEEHCEALLLKIDHLLSQEIVPVAIPSGRDKVVFVPDAEKIRSTA